MRWVLAAGVVAAAAASLGGCYLLELSPPGVPTGVQASDGGFLDRIVVSWSAVARATRYEIWRAASEGGNFAKVGEATGTTWSDTQVEVNTTYWYRVKACNRAGCSDLSAPDSGYAAGEGTPSVPTGVSATDGAYTDRVRVTWDEALGATSYEVWRDVARDGPYNLRATVTGTTYDDRDASPGVVYWYKVKACNALGCSAFSAPDSGFTFATVPDPVTNVQASDGTYNDRVRVTWTASAGAASYEVHRAESEGGTYTLRGTTTSTAYDDTGVTVGTTYWYRVRACNTAGCSAFSVPDPGFASAAGGGGGGGGGGGTPDVPGQPRNVVATDGAFPDKVRVTWSSVSGATRYEVWRADTDTGVATQIGEATGTSYDDTQPALCVEKWYEVRACNASGCGPFSVRDSGYPGAALTNVDGSKLKATVIWTGPVTAEVKLEWVHIEKNVEYAVTYEIWRRRPGEIPTKVQTTANNTWTDTTVQPGNTYYYKIRACSTQTCIPCSAFTAEVQAIVACNPAAPTTVTANKASATSITVTWSGVTGAVGYEVYRATSATGAYTKVSGPNPIAATSFTDDNGGTGLAPGTYYYKVKTCVGCGCGGLSSATGSATVP